MRELLVMLACIIAIFNTTMTEIDIDKFLKVKTSYHLDKTKSLNINNIHTSTFIKKNSFLNFGYLTAPLWIKFDIKSLKENNYVLSYGKYFINHLEVYYVKNNQVIHKYKKNEKSIFPTYISNFSALHFSLKKEESLTIYFKINSLKLINLPYFIKKQKEFNHYFMINFILSIISFSILFIMFLSNLIFYFISEKRIFRNYTLYLFSSLLFWIILLNSFNNLKTFENNLYLSQNIYYIATLLYFISFVNFFIKLLKIKFYLRRTIIFLKTITYVIFPAFICIRSFLVASDYLSFLAIINNLIDIISYIIACTIIFISIKIFNLRKKAYYVIFILWLVNALVFLIFLINMRFSLFDLNKLFILIKTMIILETALISTLLAYYLNLLENKNKKLKLLYKKRKKVILENHRFTSIKNILDIVNHQCKQPLNSINAVTLNLEVLYDKKQLKKEILAQKLNEIEKQTEFMNHTLNQFFNYLAINKKPQEINLYKTINQCIDLISFDIKNLSVKIQIKNIHKDLTIKGYKKDLMQVLLILMNNSLDSFKKNPSIKNKYIHFQTCLDENQQTIITIEDNAGGIKITPVESIFEPSVSDKNSTGIGLYIARSLLGNMKKKIYCTSYDKKTIFKIRG